MAAGYRFRKKFHLTRTQLSALFNPSEPTAEVVTTNSSTVSMEGLTPRSQPVATPVLSSPVAQSIKRSVFQEKFDTVIDSLIRREYSFVPLEKLQSGEKVAGFRYDIHVRDIPGAFDAVLAHGARKIPGTMFIQVDYSNLERSKFEQYAALARLALDAGLDIGLHTSPADSYFIWSMHGGNSRNYAQWLRVDAPEFFGRVGTDHKLRADIQHGIESHFADISRVARSIHPDMTLVSSHGGEIGQIALRLGDALSAEVSAFLDSLRPNKWLTYERMKTCGFAGDVEQFRNGLVRQVTDRGKGVDALLEGLERTLPKHNIQALIHPFGWMSKGGLLESPPQHGSNEDQETLKHVEKAAPLNVLNLQPPDDACRARCHIAYEKWTGWFPTAFRCTETEVNGKRYTAPKVPLAIINAKQSDEAYRKLIGDKSRNMLRKAEKNGYTVRRFDSSRYLKDITAIRMSKPVRSGKPVPESFQEPAKAFDSANLNFCDRHKILAVGVFSEESDTLVAYAALHNCGDMSIINTILGHGDHLKFGIMNLLVYGAYREIRDHFPSVKYINYLTLHSSTRELDRFKRSVGFVEMDLWLPVSSKPQRPDLPAQIIPTGGSAPPVIRTAWSDRNQLADLIEQKAFKKVLIRGDCCSIRAVARNPEIFGKPQIVQNEKCTMQVYMDHLVGISYPDEKMLNISNLEAMPPSLRRYYVNQNKANILQETGADLLVIDSYADSFFQIWQDKSSKAKLWVNAKFLHDRVKFEQDHVKLPYRTFNEVVVDTAKYIESVRCNNPGIPVLYLTHPIHYYRFLNRRREFCYIGEELERFVPGVYWGTHLPKEECEPVDMDSCGPGETHHYTPETYAKMIRIAADRKPKRTMAPVVW